MSVQMSSDQRPSASEDAAAAKARAAALLAQGDAGAARDLVAGLMSAQGDNADLLALHAESCAALGDVGQAVDDLSQAVMLGARGSQLFDQMGVYLQQMKLFDHAVVFHVKAINAASPEELPALYMNLGTALLGQGEHRAAAELFETVLNAHPEASGAALNLASALLQLKEYRRAAEVCRQAIARAPTTELYHNLGVALNMMPGEKPAAAEAFRQAMALDPGNSKSRHMLSVSTNEEIDVVPSDVVATTFDAYSGYYDRDMVEKLKYRVPGLVRWALMDPFYGRRRYGSILDLGCGTGLCGLLLREHTDFLRGVDLSQSMLQQAASKDIYNELEVCDILEKLGSDDRQYDAIVAADVCGYIGRLDGLLAMVHAKLAPGGLFVVSVERSPAADFAIGPGGRFAHSRDYMRRALQEAGLLVRSIAPEKLRVNAGVAVDGLIVVAQRN